jgi:hypothetical protein
MAWTQADLDEAKAVYAQFVLSVKHGDKVVQYTSGEDMLRRINEIQAELDQIAKTRRPTAGVVRFRDR